MFKNFFRKVRATLKNSGEGIAAAAGFALPFLGNANPLAALAVKFLPNILSAQYQDNPLMALLKNQAITSGAAKGSELLGNSALPPGVTPEAIEAANAGANKVSGYYPDKIQRDLARSNPGVFGKGLLDVANKSPDGQTNFLKNMFTGLYDDDGITGKGKLLGSIASTLGPGLATYLALMGEDPPETMDPKEYRSAVDDYYAAKERGENPNPADYGLAPTPADRMVGDLRYDVENKAMGGIAGINADSTPLELDPRENLMSALNIRDKAIASRGSVGLSAMPMTDMSQDVKQANMGGIIGLAMGGLEKRGMVYGPGGPKEDKIPAMLSNGEFVMTAKAVDNAGGPNAMYNLMNKLDPESSKGPTA